MLIGHVGIAQLLGVRRRDVQLSWLLTAAFLPDLARIPLTVLASPYDREMFSHSLPAVAVLSLAIGIASRIRGATVAAATTVTFACLTHWPADVFTGCKPVAPGLDWIGLFGYRHPISDLALEGFLFVSGWVLLRRQRIAPWGIGRKRVPVLLIVLQISFLASMYVNQEFFLGSTEWLWYPKRSLLPRQRPLEHLGCHPAEH